MFGLGNDGELASSKIEISIPIFLRAHIQKILSMGKTIKIIRFIESENKGADVSLPNDFYTRYKDQLTKQVINPLETPNTTKADLASEHLQTAWNSKRYSVSDNLQNEQAQSFKNQLNNAPFGWDASIMMGFEN